MGKKKIGLIVLAVLVVTALFAAPASAAYGWYTCTVIMAGPAGNQVYMRMTDTGGSFTNMWFRCYPGMEKTQLAVALTAMANSSNVYVYVDPTLPQGVRYISNIYLLSD